RRGHSAGADRLLRGFLHDRGLGRGGGPQVERGAGRTRRDTEGRRDLMDERYDAPDEEPAGEERVPDESAAEAWSWVAPGSTPSPRRGAVPEVGENPPHESRPEETTPSWAALPEPSHHPPQWSVPADTGVMGTGRREWWTDDGLQPFTIETARRLSPRSMV